MKKILLFTLISFASHIAFAQNDDVLLRLSDKIAEQIFQTISKDGRVPKGSKIAVLNFMNMKDHSDSIRTPFGAEVGKAVTHRMQQLAVSKKMPFTVLVPNAEAERMMSSFFVVPDSVDESDFWSRYLNSQKPDYYLSCAYRIADDYSAIHIRNGHLIPDRYNTNLSTIPVANFSFELNSQEEKQQIMHHQVIQDMKELCDQFAYQLKFHLKIKNIRLNYFTDELSGAVTPFSKKINETLTASLTRIGGYQVTLIEPGKRGIFDKNDNIYEVRGKFTTEGEYVKVLGFLINSGNEATIASAEFYLPKKVMETNGTVVSLTAKLTADLWTNKGMENVSYVDGEVMQIFYQTNKPAYVRLIYVTADGQRILMVDNQYIDMSMAGKPLTVPTELSCAQPFGSERIILMVSTAQFDNIPYVIQGGVKVITIDPNTAIAARGFKQEIEHLEKNIPVTTVSRK